MKILEKLRVELTLKDLDVIFNNITFRGIESLENIANEMRKVNSKIRDCSWWRVFKILELKKEFSKLDKKSNDIRNNLIKQIEIIKFNLQWKKFKSMLEKE